jgi:acyl-CoA synthetase (AMP-forming)/AMP-acid ligase II
MQSHRAVILNGAMTAQMHGKNAADTVVTTLPCPHVYGNVVFNGAMMYGLTLVLHSRFDAGEVLGSRHTAQPCSKPCRQCTCTCWRILTSIATTSPRSRGAPSAARRCQ